MYVKNLAVRSQPPVHTMYCRIASIVTLYIKRETKGEVLEDRRPESILERISVTSYGTAEQHED